MAESEKVTPFTLEIDRRKLSRLDKYRADEISLTEICPAKMQDSGKKPIEVATKNTYVGSDEDIANKLIQCAEIHRSLHDHPAILKVIAIHYKAPNLCLVLERVDGSLRDIFGEDPKSRALRDEVLSKITGKEIVSQVINGLAYIHSNTDQHDNKITHRDVKPENILFQHRERDGKFQIKYTDFDSAKQLDVGISTHKVTTGVFTIEYKDPQLEEKQKAGEEITIEVYEEHDKFGAACTIFEILGDGRGLFQGSGLAETLKKKEDYDFSNLHASAIEPLAKNVIQAMAHSSCRISMEEAQRVPYFHDNPAHFHAMNEVNESIIQLDEEDAEDKTKLDGIELSFFMVLVQIWQTFTFINKRILKATVYSNSFGSFIRYSRNLLMHAQQNQMPLRTQFGDDVTSDKLLDIIEEEVPGMKLHIQWIAKKFFPHLSFTKDFPEACLRAYEDLMEKKRKEIGAGMAELHASICPKPVEKVGAVKERAVAVLETINNNMIKSVQMVNPSFKLLNESTKKLEKKRNGLQKKVENLKDRASPVDKAEADLAEIDLQLEANNILECQELARQAESYLTWVSSRLPHGGGAALTVPVPVPVPPKKLTEAGIVLPRPVSGIIADRRLRPLPPAFQDQWKSAEEWPVGSNFVSFQHESQIYVWGGRQWQLEEEFSHLPSNVIHAYDVEADSWKEIRASGDIHPGSKRAAGVVVDDKAYLFGGYHSSLTNDITSLSLPEGVFESIPVTGDRPAPRANHRGWAYKGNVFFFGGETKGHKGEKGILVGEEKGGRDNLLARFDPTNTSWSAPETKGRAPSPRDDSAVALLQDRVFVHGGYGNGEIHNDIHALNMTTMIWTLISESGPWLYDHSLSPISPTRLLLVGGVSVGVCSNKVWIFDANDSSWDEQEFCGKKEGLSHHGAIEMQTRDGLKVFCFGGLVNYETRRHPSNMLIFSIE